MNNTITPGQCEQTTQSGCLCSFRASVRVTGRNHTTLDDYPPIHSIDVCGQHADQFRSWCVDGRYFGPYTYTFERLSARRE